MEESEEGRSSLLGAFDATDGYTLHHFSLLLHSLSVSFFFFLSLLFPVFSLVTKTMVVLAVRIEREPPALFFCFFLPSSPIDQTGQENSQRLSLKRHKDVQTGRKRDSQESLKEGAHSKEQETPSVDFPFFLPRDFVSARHDSFFLLSSLGLSLSLLLYVLGPTSPSALGNRWRRERLRRDT